MGYGSPIQVPQSLGTPRNIRSPYNPGLPAEAELPFLRAAGLEAIRQGARLPAMPPMVQVPQVQDARAREAAQFAAEMGAAFSVSKAQKKAGERRAKATERAKSKAGESADKQRSRRAKKVSGARRRLADRIALYEARGLGLGPDLYRTARL